MKTKSEIEKIIQIKYPEITNELLMLLAQYLKEDLKEELKKLGRA